MHRTSLLLSVRLLLNDFLSKLHQLFRKSHVVGFGATLLGDLGRCDCRHY
jgi:hypothetical protein